MGLDTWIGGSPKPEQIERFIQPTNDTALGPPVEIKSPPVLSRHSALRTPHSELGRAWPPLVSGDRLQPLHELHGVHRFLPVRRVRRR